MHIRPSVAFVSGEFSSTRWSQVVSLPSCYAVVEIEDSEGQARNIGIGVISQITEALQIPPHTIPEIEKLVDEVMSEQIISLLVLVSHGKTVFVVQRGKGKVYVKRGVQLATLLKDKGGISGEVKIGDTILMVSGGLTKYLTDEQLSKSFDHLPAREVAEKITLLIHESSREIFGSAMVYQVMAFDEDVVPTEEKESPPQSRQIPEIAIKVRQFIQKWKRSLSHPRLTLLIVIICLVVLFVGSVILGIKKQLSNTEIRKADVTIALARQKYEEGSALGQLNPLKSREELSQAKSLLEPIVKTLPVRTKESIAAKALYKDVTDALTLASQIYRVTPSLFYDVSLSKKGAKASSISLYDTYLAILDAIGKTLYVLSIDTKNNEIVAGGQALETVKLVGIHGNLTYIMTDLGIFETKIGTKLAATPKIKKDDAWGTLSALTAFAGNIYLADTMHNRIWKYIATDDGFSERYEYLNPDTLPDLSRMTNMMIDGSVWFGTRNGKILKFTQGKQDTFITKGIEPELGNTLYVYTDDESARFYVLDVDNKRVVVLDKEGVYVAQYKWNEVLNVSQFVVSEKQKKILLVVDGLIYSIDLK